MKRFINVTRAKTIVFALGFSALTATAAESGQQTPIASTDATNNPLDASAAVAANSSIDPTKKLIRGVFLQAQTETGQNPPGVASVSVRPPADIPPPTRKGPLSELGDELEKQGFTFGLFFTNGYFTNPTAGIKPGSSMDSPALFMSANADLTKLLGVPNTQLHITEAWEPLSQNNGDYSYKVGSSLAPFPATTTSSNLVKLTLSHDLFDKQLQLEYGRMNLGDDFMVATMCAGCITSTPLITVGVPPFDKSLWGARASYKLSPHTRLGLGVTEDNYGLFSQSSGWDWTSDTRKGTIWLGNMTYTSDFSDSRYPLNAEVGVYHNTSPYRDDLDNTDGSTQSQNPFGTAVKHDSGTSGFYGQARKVVWTKANADGIVPPHVAVYGGAFVTPGSGQSFPLELYAGTEYGGFVKGNPAALVGSTVRYLQLSEGRALNEQQTSAARGWGDDKVHRDTFTFDVHGQYGLAPGVLANASAQYFLNPNRQGPNALVGPTQSGWLFALTFVIDIGRISGLSR